VDHPDDPGGKLWRWKCRLDGQESASAWKVPRGAPDMAGDFNAQGADREGLRLALCDRARDGICLDRD
jgi:hypothetical protein